MNSSGLEYDSDVFYWGIESILSTLLINILRFDDMIVFYVY